MQEPKMDKYITNLEVSVNDSQENLLKKQGFTQIDVDVTQGVGANRRYLWYKKTGGEAITRIQLTYNDEMQPGLNSEGYSKIDKDLNPTNGDAIKLWFFRGTTNYDVKIVDLHVTDNMHDEVQKFSQGWERLACDLTRKNGGKRVYLWMKRETPTYICDVTATDNFEADSVLFQQGYIRMDRDAGGTYIFIWYRQSADAGLALKDLQISTNDGEFQSFKNQHYDQVSVKLRDGSRGEPVYLWFKRDDRIKDLAFIVDPATVEEYEKAGVKIINKNLGKDVEFLCFYC